MKVSPGFIQKADYPTTCRHCSSKVEKGDNLYFCSQCRKYVCRKCIDNGKWYYKTKTVVCSACMGRLTQEQLIRIGKKESIMIVKLLRRLCIAWCLFGIAKICIWVNPWILKLSSIIGIGSYVDTFSATLIMWLIIIIGAGTLLTLALFFHWFSIWFFNEKK